MNTTQIADMNIFNMLFTTTTIFGCLFMVLLINVIVDHVMSDNTTPKTLLYIFFIIFFVSAVLTAGLA